MINSQYLHKIFKASNLPGLILLPDAPHFTIVEASEGYLKLVNKKESELIGRGIFEIFTDNPQPKVAGDIFNVEQSLQAVVSTCEVHKMKSRRNKECYWNIENIPVLNEKEEIEYIIHIVADVSEISLIEKPLIKGKQLPLSDNGFRSLIQGSSDLISIFDLEANYVYTSASSFSVLGWHPEEFIGKNVAEFIHPDDREIVFSNFLKLGLEKKIIISPFRFQHKNGDWRWLETKVTDLTDDPSVNGIVTNSRDVTERILA